MYKLKEDGTLLRRNISGSMWWFVVPNIPLEKLKSLDDDESENDMDVDFDPKSSSNPKLPKKNLEINEDELDDLVLSATYTTPTFSSHLN